jgi:hypothetical protein
LREVKAPTLLRQTANRWRQGCQSYAPAALYPQVSLFLKIVAHKISLLIYFYSRILSSLLTVHSTLC